VSGVVVGSVMLCGCGNLRFDVAREDDVMRLRERTVNIHAFNKLNKSKYTPITNNQSMPHTSMALHILLQSV
jgi:hypothetical protein